MLFDYLLGRYGENAPIFVSDICIEGVSNNTLRQQVKKLADAGKLKRFDTGVYFIPGESIFKSGAMISPTQVIEHKYLKDMESVCGYMSGLQFANQIGLTTQVPMVYEIVSNKATRDYREVEIGKTKVLLRKPRTKITDDNFKVLQFLDLMKEIDSVSELEGQQLTKRLLAYMRASGVMFKEMERYFPLYPNKLYKNLYETGLLNGVSA